jgi:predicted nucleic acid-binding protein
MDRVYVDTSVFGGTQDEEFAEASKHFFSQARKGAFVVLVSALTTDELDGSPESVRRVLDDLPPEQVEPVLLNEEIKALAEEYVRAGVLGSASADDATHVATATVANADLIVSWNFRHIVNFNRIRGFNAVNVRMGYRPIAILSPREVVDVDEYEN